MSNEIKKYEENTSISLINDNITALSRMVNEGVEHQAKVAPQFQGIATKVLAMLDNQSELDNLDAKDLIKLVETASKAIIQPVEQLTKLVTAVSALYEKSQLEDRLRKVEALMTKIEKESETASFEEVEPVLEESKKTSIDELL